MEDISIDLSVKSALIAVFVLGLFAGIVVGGAGALTLQDTDSTSQTADKEAETKDVAPEPQESDSDTGKDTVSVSDISLEGERTMGSEDAEVTLLYWGDFNCMYCYRFAQQSLPQIKENFVDSGEVRIIYKNLITMGEDSVTLAKASQAAWKQVGESEPSIYWNFHSQLHEDQEVRKQNSQPVKEDIRDTAGKVEGIDVEKLMDDIESIDDEAVTDDVQEARKRGITGTPGFIVYRTGTDKGTPIQGAQPYSTFESEINSLLEQ